MERLNAMAADQLASQNTLSVNMGQPQGPVTPGQMPNQMPNTPPAPTPYEFISGQEFDPTDPAQLNQVLNNVAHTVTERLLQTMPTVATQVYTHNANVVEASQRFYKENPDLANFKSLVTVEAGKLYAQNPSQDLYGILKIAGQNIRGYLRLGAQVPNPAAPDGTAPGGGGTPPRTEPKPEEKKLGPDNITPNSVLEAIRKG
jgi:hypothetical protein